MDILDNKEPAVINICGYNKKDYDEFKRAGVLKDSPNNKLFTIAMAFGFMDSHRKPLDKKLAYTRPQYFTEKEKCIIKAVAAFSSKKGLDVIANKKEVWAIAEEYAAHGIELLVDMNKTRGTFAKKLESYLLDNLMENISEITDDKDDNRRNVPEDIEPIEELIEEPIEEPIEDIDLTLIDESETAELEKEIEYNPDK